MYKPSRSARHYYMWDLMHEIEENQCRTCIHSKLQGGYDQEFAEEYPMCGQVEGEIITEAPVECLDELPDGMVVCTAYRNADRALEARGQERLL